MPAEASPSPVVLVGGGLANGLIAYRLRQLRPEIPLIVLDGAATLGGEHTWSFHETDVAPETLAWLQPFVVRRWPGQSIRFPGVARDFTTPYCSIDSARFHEVVAASLGDALRLSTPVRAIRRDGVVLDGGVNLAASAVIDGRGRPPRRRLDLGWQKFVGLEVETAEPHGVALPVIMDATVPQLDGYRFVYLLPFGPRRILIEDTHYSDTPGFDEKGYEAEILAYAAERGWRVERVLRAERGALPIALDGDIDGLCADMAEVARSGLAAGLFQPTTGYSLPDAAAFAERIAALPSIDADGMVRLARDHARGLWRRRRFYRLLNRMLFHAAEPQERYRVLSHFYRLPQGLIERFYGDRLRPFDKLRILTGRPPVPISRAIGAMLRARTAAPAMGARP
jgi:lycopene beta-cyclase